MKTYYVENKIIDWLENHSEKLYEDILAACENAIDTDEDRIFVCVIITLNGGITEFSIPSREKAIDSLRKAEACFVKVEDYEKAARARDCVKIYKEKLR